MKTALLAGLILVACNGSRDLSLGDGAAGAAGAESVESGGTPGTGSLAVTMIPTTPSNGGVASTIYEAPAAGAPASCERKATLVYDDICDDTIDSTQPDRRVRSLSPVIQLCRRNGELACAFGAKQFAMKCYLACVACLNAPESMECSHAMAESRDAAGYRGDDCQFTQ